MTSSLPLRALWAAVLLACASACLPAASRVVRGDADGDGVEDARDACPQAGGRVDASGCPVKDTDGDGVGDAEDACPRLAGLASRKGCPVRDADEDGVEDAEDRCPQRFGLRDRQGCPVEDPDRDGLEGDDDLCPDEAGPRERQGCPAPDADGDGVLDEVDACPQEEGLPTLRGCPERDRDGDDVPDHRDNCPRERGPAANQGCPAERKQRVALRGDRMVPLDEERVGFDPGLAKLQPRSHALLDHVALVLLAHPELGVLTVAAHTDNRGDAEDSRVLTQARAEAVCAYLVERGVPPERLEAHGLGADQPLESNDTAQGRAANRRVDFVFETPTKAGRSR